jgi:hypothetical protein
MTVNDAAPAPPGFIDRVRDLIAKVFGWPGRKPEGAKPVSAEGAGGQAAGRPADKAMRASAPQRRRA